MHPDKPGAAHNDIQSARSTFLAAGRPYIGRSHIASLISLCDLKLLLCHGIHQQPNKTAQWYSGRHSERLQA